MLVHYDRYFGDRLYKIPFSAFLHSRVASQFGFPSPYFEFLSRLSGLTPKFGLVSYTYDCIFGDPLFFGLVVLLRETPPPVLLLVWFRDTVFPQLG